jgi:hypothetical protein
MLGALAKAMADDQNNFTTQQLLQLEKGVGPAVERFKQGEIASL